MYLGSSFALNTFVDIRPEEFAIATTSQMVWSVKLWPLCKFLPITAATTARLDSLGVLLEYHALTNTEGANACWCNSVSYSEIFDGNIVKFLHRLSARNMQNMPHVGGQ